MGFQYVSDKVYHYESITRRSVIEFDEKSIIIKETSTLREALCKMFSMFTVMCNRGMFVHHHI